MAKPHFKPVTWVKITSGKFKGKYRSQGGSGLIRISSRPGGGLITSIAKKYKFRQV